MKGERLRAGDRFRLSPLGVERCPKLCRTGTVIGPAKTKSVIRVRIDGTRSDRSIHRSYIMLEPDVGTAEPAKDKSTV
jgi:hypothetical protein